MAGTGLGNVINETYNTIGNLFSSPFSPIIYGGAIPLICVATQSRYDTKVDKMERLKYFMENKDAINSVAEEEITILDAKHLSWEKLEDYAEKGRSKVLR